MEKNDRKEIESKVIVGGAGSGKTASLLGYLVQKDERIVTIEDTVELTLGTNLHDDKKTN